MGWFGLSGSKCDRCGLRVGKSREGHSTCTSCSEELALKVKAEGEESRICPVDQSKMTKEVAHMLVIDRCATCHGVWLDGGELEHISEINDRALIAMSRGMLMY